MKARLIDTGASTPAMNMAIDEALLQSPEPVIRLYTWDPPGLSLGYAQDIKDINEHACKEQGIGIVRRITGGKTVLHDKELTYSIIIDESLMPGSIIESYKKISKGIISALLTIGIKADMKISSGSKPSSAICFTEPSYYEIVAEGKKIVGSAQRRINGKLLQHGSILIGLDAKKLVSAFNIRDRNQAITNAEQKIISINQLLPRVLNIQELKSALIDGFQQALDLQLSLVSLTEEEKKSAEILSRAKYTDDSWNRERKV